jgi:spermidine synthase
VAGVRLTFGLGVTKVARKRTAAEDAFRTLTNPFPQLAVRGHHPDRRLDLVDLSCDPVVRSLPALPHDHDLMAVCLGPGLAQLDELALGNVGPERAANVLGVNQDRGHPGRFSQMARGGRYEAGAIAVAVFASGAALLGIEIAASRVLSPFFGNSLYVWGALIGVVLSGLAVGYWAGGLLADRFPALSLLLGVIGLGSLAVLAIPLIDEPVLEAIVRWDPGPRANAVAAATALFGAPSVLFAMVAPVAVRLRIQAVATAGTTAGRLFAISTAGSIVGTFATAFWLIPELGTDQLLAVIAATLFGALVLVSVSQRLVSAAVAAVVATAGASVAAVRIAPDTTGGRLGGVAAQNWAPAFRIRGQQEPVGVPEEGFQILFRKDTAYHRIFVVQDEKRRFLRFGSSYQSAMDLDDPFTGFIYTSFFDLGLAYVPEARDVLFVGLGGGSAPKRFWRDFPQLRLQVVELDPVVVDVAHRFFQVPRDPRLKIDVDDGRRYLVKHDRRYDVIALDTFFEDGIPFHLTTREFLELVHDRLTPGGVVVTNTIGTMNGEGSKLFRAIYRTYRSVFPTVVVYPVHTGEAEGQPINLIIVATDGAEPAKSVLLDRWQTVRTGSRSAPDLTTAIRSGVEGGIGVADVPLLTDDYAPTDALLLDQ